MKQSRGKSVRTGESSQGSGQSKAAMVLAGSLLAVCGLLPAGAALAQAGSGQGPVGQAPEGGSKAAAVAPIFEQPGVLTAPGHLVLEPSFQYSYSSSNRVALVGYTVIPAINIGLINVQEVKRDTFIGTLTTRFGLTNRLEIESKVPYVHRSDSQVAFPTGQGSGQAQVFDAAGSDMGDIEMTGRYQWNDGGADSAYYISTLRVKSRTGRDPFQSELATNFGSTFNNIALQRTLPTGSGFYAVQPGLTMLMPSDPAVFFGSISYLANIKRHAVNQNTDQGTVSVGDVAPGAILGFNFGMGMAINGKTSFSIGYDHASVGKTLINGLPPAGSTRLELGTLLIGFSQRVSENRTVNVSIGAGITRDTPDLTLTLRMPFTL